MAIICCRCIIEISRGSSPFDVSGGCEADVAAFVNWSVSLLIDKVAVLDSLYILVRYATLLIV